MKYFIIMMNENPQHLVIGDENYALSVMNTLREKDFKDSGISMTYTFSKYKELNFWYYKEVQVSARVENPAATIEGLLAALNIAEGKAIKPTKEYHKNQLDWIEDKYISKEPECEHVWSMAILKGRKTPICNHCGERQHA